jgi:uncharacterized cupin superfamily protein
MPVQTVVDPLPFEQLGYLGPIALMTSEQAHFLARHLRFAGRGPAIWNKELAAVDPLICAVATNPRLLNLVRGLIGNDVILWGASTVIRKPGQAHPWHCDMESASPAGGFVSVWIGLGNTAQDKGLKFIRGSHAYGVTIQECAARAGILRDARTDEVALRLARERDEAAEIVCPEVNDGGAMLFDGRIWHGSENSARNRIALLLQYARADATVRMPAPEQFEWPFEFQEAPPPVIAVAGRAGADGKRLVAPPSLRHRVEIAPSVHPIDPQLRCADGVLFAPTRCFEGRTPNCDYLECHYSVLMPGHSPHPPHTHLHEEILVVMNGEAELVLPDQTGAPQFTPAPAGTGIYYPSYRPHTIRNSGTAPVSYAMLKWKSAAVHSEALRTKLILAKWLERNHSGTPKDMTVLFEGPTGFQAKLQAHTTYLAPGGGYAAHRDQHDVAIFLLEGEVTIMGERIVAPGVAFYPGGTLHDMRVSGTVPARYLVWEFHKALRHRPGPRARARQTLASVVPA